MRQLRSIAYRAVTQLSPLFARIGPGESRRSIGIIVCHGIYDDRIALPVRPPTTALPLKSFSTNIRALQKTHTFISLAEAVNMLVGRAVWQPRCVVLTFDDSLSCLVHLVAPLLVKWGVPATFFLSTDAIETGQPYWWHRLGFVTEFAQNKKIPLDLDGGRILDFEASVNSRTFLELKSILRGSAPSTCERLLRSIEFHAGISLLRIQPAYPFADLMSWDDVRMLTRMNMTIGSHTASHPNLTLLGAADLAAEMRNSKKMLEDKTGAQCDHFCYPYGAHSDAVCAAARAAGYLSAVTTIEPGWNSPGADLFRLRRFHLSKEPYKLPYIVLGLNRWSRRSRVTEYRETI